MDSLTGQLDITVREGDGETHTNIVDPFKEGYAGHYTVDDFVLPDDTTDIGENIRVCVSAISYNNEANCVEKERTEASVQKIEVYSPSGIGRAGDINKDTTYYEEDGNVVQEGDYVPSVYQGDDSESTNTNKDQGSGVTVAFGDDSDNNNLNIDQRSTFADVIKDLVPKVGSAVKNTAREILN